MSKKEDTPKVPAKGFKVGDKSYKFVVAQFIYDGNIIKASDALKNEILLAELVDIKAGVIEEVSASEGKEGE